MRVWLESRNMIITQLHPTWKGIHSTEIGKTHCPTIRSCGRWAILNLAFGEAGKKRPLTSLCILSILHGLLQSSLPGLLPECDDTHGLGGSLWSPAAPAVDLLGPLHSGIPGPGHARVPIFLHTLLHSVGSSRAATAHLCRQSPSHCCLLW